MSLITDIKHIKPGRAVPAPANGQMPTNKKTPLKKKPTAAPVVPKQRHWRQWWKRYRAVVIVGAVLLVALGGFTGVEAKRLYQSAQGAKAEFDLASQAANDQHYDQATTHLQKASAYLEQAQAVSRGLVFIKWLPVVHTQFRVIDTLISVGLNVSSAGQAVLPIADRVHQTLGDDSVTVDSISEAERRALLEAISQSPEQIARAQRELEMAVAALEQLPTKGVLGRLRSIVALLQTQLPNLRTAVTKGFPFLKVAPTVLGYPDEQTYLFLLQNNTELRPTGGFIGTYGILRLKDGNIAEFKTDNIYNLDNPVKDELHIAPPEPLHQYLGSTQWFMRDSNWNPDFTIAAAKAEEFYHAEHGPVENLDGVIAVTPVLIHDLLAVTGPIMIDGEAYTTENLTEKLQYEVEVGFKQSGITDSGRKAVIGKLANAIMQRVMQLPKAQWPQLIEILLRDLEEKHIMIYSKNEAVQTLVKDIGWDGSIRLTPDDYLMVVDANLAALKTDRVMTKQLDYTVQPEGNDLVAKLTLRYKNDGEFNFFTTRYRTYTRIYVPAGSALIASSGWLTNDRYLGGQETQPDVSLDETVNKTVIAGFISVEPKTEEVITVQYRLPAVLAERMKNDGYHLYAQKQPGTDNVNLTADITTPRALADISPLDGLKKIDNNKVHLSVPLLTDVSVDLTY